MIKVVSTFIELPEHPRPAEEYHKLGKQLIEAVRLGEWPLLAMQLRSSSASCIRWMSRTAQVACPTHSVGDNSRKNSLGYHMVQHHKTTVMTVAAPR
jgi:hypothetical protein